MVQRATSQTMEASDMGSSVLDGRVSNSLYMNTPGGKIKILFIMKVIIFVSVLSML